MTINVTAIKAFSDNYIWAIQSGDSSHVAVVDPGDAAPCIDFIKQHNLTLNAILITHHHPDHTGGIAALKAFAEEHGQQITVYGPASESIPSCDVKLVENDIVTLSFPTNTLDKREEVIFSILDLPGHTLGHIAYVNDDALFCGDTLFSGGCGRLFEGTPAQMHQSLSKLTALNASTPVYCTHEYTQSNLNFALAVEPSNQQLIDYHAQVSALRADGKITLPSSIGLELAINPFVRCNQESIMSAATNYSGQQINDEIETFAAIRLWKDNF